MLFLCPLTNLGKKVFGAKDADHRAEGEDLHQESGFVGKVVVDGGNPGVLFFVVVGVFFIVCKVEHTAL